MAEGSLASAVIVPDEDNLAPSPQSGLKRRQSSTTDLDSDSKRRRLSNENENQTEAAPERRPSTEDQNLERKRNRRDEERKRGQRLFGSLLGTLSQSSNSAAQRRRADIERKQQDKLKLQDEEYGELKKKRREERLALRKKEQRVYEKELMHTRHANLLAMAHFLKTKTEPVLYYKPWELRPEDEEVIREQIREAEASIARETEEFEARITHEEKEPENNQEQDAPAEKQEQEQVSSKDIEGAGSTEQQADTVTQESNHDKDHSEIQPENAPVTNEEVAGNSNQDDVHRGAEDDGGEVVEDNEDTVIY
ncbi:pinin/SDK/memA/ protein conserved region-domain-containing protein [Aspergillus egyptiacus]|nr:pinin/SDK/memA/ protein conserved region-domain-containing protein [Aspergillus egyptiacus]